MNIPPNAPMFDNMAVVLGVKPGDFNNRWDEIMRLNMLGLCLQRIRMQAEEQQDTVFAAFSALYLPATVERFLNSPTTINPDRDAVEDLQLYNAYFETLVAIQHTPYFAKYLRSTKAIAAGGKLLPQALAQRLVQLGPRWERQIINPPSDKPDGYYSSAAGSTIQLLSTLCTAFIKESDQNIVIPQETKNALIPLLRRWARRRDFLGTVSTRVLDILLSPSFCVGVNNVRRQLKNWNICGMPNCIIKTDLKACGRCQTVRYVGGRLDPDPSRPLTTSPH